MSSSEKEDKKVLWREKRSESIEVEWNGNEWGSKKRWKVGDRFSLSVCLTDFQEDDSISPNSRVHATQSRETK